MRSATLAFVALACLSLAPAAHAQSLGMDFTGGGSLGSPPFSATVGYDFTTSVPLDLSGLGYFDAGNDGLADAHTVGLWDSTGTLLTSMTVPAGTGADQDIVSASVSGSFRIQNIPTLTLAAGTYTIGGFTPPSSSDAIYGTGTAVPFPGVTFGGARIIGGFARPTVPTGADAGYFGPTFLVAQTPVPEPGSLALLLGMGTMGAAFLRRRKQANKAA